VVWWSGGLVVWWSGKLVLLVKNFCKILQQKQHLSPL